MDYNKDLLLAQKNISDFDIEVKEDPASVAGFLYVENEIKNSLSYIKKESPLSVQKLKGTLSKYIPYTLKQGIKKIINKEPVAEVSGWFGNYSSWEVVEKQCGGYDDSLVFEKVKQATLKVKKGEAAFEFDEKLLSFLNSVAAENNKIISVLDFGGSLGSSYFQYRKLLESSTSVKWGVVEQKHFVEFGKTQIQNNELQFFYTPQECLATTKVDVLLLSSVLSYLKDPYAMLNDLMSLSIKYVVIDRNLFLKDEDRLTKQIVPSSIYKASYPCWILSEKKVLQTLSSRYEVMNVLDPYNGLEVDLSDKKAYFKGVILKLK